MKVTDINQMTKDTFTPYFVVTVEVSLSEMCRIVERMVSDLGVVDIHGDCKS